MKHPLSLLLLFLVLGGCSGYEANDFHFSKQEEAFFDCFHVDQPVYYESNLHDTDTIAVSKLDIEVNPQGGSLMGSPASNSRMAYVKYLPVDHWQSSIQSGANPAQPEDQTLLRITKFPQEKRVEYSVSFKDFTSVTDSAIGEFHSEPFQLNDRQVKNYYVIKRQAGRPVNTKSILLLYWTVEEGLVGYMDNGGEVWTKK